MSFKFNLRGTRFSNWSLIVPHIAVSREETEIEWGPVNIIFQRESSLSGSLIVDLERKSPIKWASFFFPAIMANSSDFKHVNAEFFIFRLTWNRINLEENYNDEEYYDEKDYVN